MWTSNQLVLANYTAYLNATKRIGKNDLLKAIFISITTGINKGFACLLVPVVVPSLNSVGAVSRHHILFFTS